MDSRRSKKTAGRGAHGAKPPIVNGARGVISIMLAILILPFFSVAALLVEAERYQSAVTLLDEAMGSAAMSTLADYDKYIYQRFGAMSVSPKTDVDASYKDFLRYNSEGISRSVDFNSAGAKGEYPLANKTVLERAIQEYGKLNVPMTLADETLNLTELIQSLEELTKITGILETITSAAKTLDGIKKVKADMEKLKSEAKGFDKLAKDYGKKYDAFKDAVQTLKDAIAAADAIKEDDYLTKADWEAAKANAVAAAESARGGVDDAKRAYAKLCRDIAAQIAKVMEAKTKVVDDITDIKSNAVGTVTNAVAAGGNYKNNIKNNIDEANNQIKSDIAKSTEDGAKALFDAAGDAVKEFDDRKVGPIKTGLVAQAEKAEAFDSGNTPPMPDDSEYHYVRLDGVPTETDIDKIIKSLDEKGPNGDIMALLQALVDFMNGLVNTDVFFNPACANVIDGEFYQTSMGGLPSATHPDVGDPFSDMVRSIGKFFTAVAKLGADAGGLRIFSMIGDVCDAVSAMCDFVANLIKTIKNMAIRIGKILTGDFDSVFNMTYFAYNLPNRTDIERDGNASEDSHTMAGYRYGEEDHLRKDPVALGLPAVADIGALVSTLKSFAAGGEDHRFQGAELEYIFFGSRSEIANQGMAFFAVYFMRMIIDVVPILLNKEVQAMAQIPFIGAIPVVLVVLAEPFLDTVLLVNGKKASLFKSTVFLTPSGIEELPAQFINLKSLSDAAKTKLSDENDKIKSKIKNSGIQQKKNPAVEYAKGLLDCSYADHMFCIMMLLGDEKAYMYRLADLIQMDGYAYWKHKDPSVSYNINHAYTYVQGNADVGFNQLLPIPSLSTHSFYDVKREQWRGY